VLSYSNDDFVKGPGVLVVWLGPGDMYYNIFFPDILQIMSAVNPQTEAGPGYKPGLLIQS